MQTSRRQFFQTSAATGLGLAAGTGLSSAQLPRSAAKADFTVNKGNINQSIMGWCFAKHYKTAELAKHCKDIGLVAMEGIPREAYPEVLKMGLKISLVGGNSFMHGPCNPEFHDEVITKLTEGINVAADIGTKNVITFTGMRFDGMDDEKAAQRCIDTWKEVLPLAEKKSITLAFEHLNSRDGSQPMTGHPGYFGDDVDFCIDLIKRVGSESFKLLFDIYHVSIMNGDIIRRIRNDHQYIAHYHTAGNPGRGEIDDTQEINYPPIMREILKTGYTGYVAQEFIPTWDDPLLALRHAAMTCDV